VAVNVSVTTRFYPEVLRRKQNSLISLAGFHERVGQGALPTMLSMGLNSSFPYRSMGQGLFDYTLRTSWFGGVTFWSIIKYDRIIASPRGIYKAMDCLSLLLGPGHFSYVFIAHNILIGHILGVLLTMLSMDYGLFSKVFGSLVLWPDDISQLMLSFPLMAVYLSSSKA